MLNYLKATYQVLRDMPAQEKTKTKAGLILVLWLELFLYLLVFTEICY